MRLFQCSRTPYHTYARVLTAVVVAAATLLAPPVQRGAILFADEAPPEFLRTLGVRGSDPGEFESPDDVAIGPNGLIYVADETNYRVQVIDSEGDPVGSPWEGMFEYPNGIAVDVNSTVHVCDRGDSSAARITAHDPGDSSILHSWGGWSEFSSPSDIATAYVDGTVYVYVADTNNSRIRKFSYDSTTGYTHVASWDGSGTEGQLYNPGGVTVAPDGSIYVADTGHDRIVRFTADGDYLTHWGVRYSQHYGYQIGEFWEPKGVAVDADGNVYVADTCHHCIQKFTADGVGLAMWGTWSGGEGDFNYPAGIAIDRYGTIYVADTGNHRLQVFTYPLEPPEFLTEWGTEGSADGEFSQPRGVAVDPDGNVYVADALNNRIQRFTLNAGTGQYGHDETWGDPAGGTLPGQFNFPAGIAADSQGSIYVADNNNSRVQKFDGSAWTVIAGSGEFSANPTDCNFYLVSAVAVAADGALYTTDTGTNRIQVFSYDPGTGDYTFSHKWGGPGTGEGQFDGPYGIVLDAQGYVYVSDYGRCRIQKFDSNGNFIAMWGSDGSGDGEFSFPRGMTVDSSGLVYVAEYWNHRIQALTGNGLYRTKWGVQGAAAGEFSFPFDVELGTDGRFYVADTINHRIQVFGYSETEDVVIELTAGWNMVSVPVVPADTSRAAVFPPADVVAVYTWNPVTKSYEVPTNIAPEVGYWVAVAGDKTITVTGTPVTQWESNLTAGWNMCGSVCGDPIQVSDLQDDPSPSIVRSAIYSWNPTGKSYATASQIDEGLGYWVATTCNCSLTVAPSA
jgi:sugar lactone lactonase YvrE